MHEENTDLSEQVHGLNVTYTKGCRCDECRAAHAKQARDDRKREHQQRRVRIERTLYLIGRYGC